MSLELISVVLWIPFLFVVLIAGIVFGRTAWKDGFIGTMIALLATLLAAVLSLFLARLLASAIGALLLNTVLPDLYLEAGGLSGVVKPLVAAALQAAVALLVFPLLMLISTIVLRVLGRKIDLNALGLARFQLRGLSVCAGLVTAVIYALFLLLPFYGTIGAALPMMDAVLTLTDESGSPEPMMAQGMPGEPYLMDDPQAEVKAVLEVMQEHPVVKLSDSGLTGMVYDEMTALRVGGQRVDIPDLTDTMNRLAEALKLVADAERGNREPAVRAFLEQLRAELVDQPWFYSLFKGVVEEVRKEAKSHPAAETEAALALLDILDCPQADFERNVDALMDFAFVSLECGVLDYLENDDLTALASSGIVREAGALASFSTEAVAVKKLMMAAMISDITGDSIHASVQLLDSFGVGAMETIAEQVQEAEAIFAGFKSERQMILRHPRLGEPALKVLLERYGFANILGFWEGYAGFAWIETDAHAQELLIGKLKECAAKPVGVGNYEEYTQTVMELTYYLDINYEYRSTYHYFNGDPEVFRFALDVVGRERFRSSELPAGDEVYRMLDAATTYMEQNPGLGQYVDPYSGETDYEDFAGPAANLMEIMIAAIEGRLPEDRSGMENGSGNTDVYGWINACFYNTCGWGGVKQLVDTEGSDPLGMGAVLSAGQKQALLEIAEGIVQNTYEMREEMETRLEYLRRFLGE